MKLFEGSDSLASFRSALYQPDSRTPTPALIVVHGALLAELHFRTFLMFWKTC